MHVQTHILSGWCAANLLPLDPRQRLFCMIAASAPDLDGLGVLWSQAAYHDYHHVLGHNLLFALLLSWLLAMLARRRAMTFLACLTLVHLHLAMDYIGSGPLWKIHYLWPFSVWSLMTPENFWELYSWQNLSVAAILLTLTLWIAFRCGRTPLEALMPSLDRQLVALLQRRRPTSPADTAPRGL